MYSFKEYVDAGGLMSYGTSFPDLVRRAPPMSIKSSKEPSLLTCPWNNP
jgi:hypothetical protein